MQEENNEIKRFTKTSIDEVIRSRRLPVLFIGSGISKRYIENSPTWDELLQECFSIVDPSGVTLSRLKEKCKREKFSSFETNQYLGSEIEERYNQYYYDKLMEEKVESVPEWAKTTSPFKMYLKERFENYSLIDTKKTQHLKREKALLKQLSEKISAVLTTNYDTFLENEVFNEGFEVYYKQSDLFKSERFNVAEIYKIHGSIENPSSMVFSKQDYDDFKKNRRLIIAKMLTLFSDSPIIFLGYSLDDENIREIILDFLDCIEVEDIHKLRNHFIFIERKKNERNLIETVENIITNRGSIPITKISTDNFIRLFYLLNKITPGLPASVVKNAKRLIKKIVESGLETGNTNAIIIDEEEIESLSDSNLAIAFGDRRSLVAKYGYSSFSLKYLFEDILFDNKNYIAKSVIQERLSVVANKTLVPIFKYYSKLTTKEQEEAIHVNKFLKRNSYDTIFGNNIKKQMKNTPVFNTLQEISEYIEQQQEERINFIFMILSKNLQKLSTNEIRQFAIGYYNIDSDSCFKSTFFKRTVMYLDVLENKKV